MQLFRLSRMKNINERKMVVRRPEPIARVPVMQLYMKEFLLRMSSSSSSPSPFFFVNETVHEEAFNKTLLLFRSGIIFEPKTCTSGEDFVRFFKDGRKLTANSLMATPSHR